MMNIVEISKMLRKAYEEGQYDPMVEKTLLDTIEYVENTEEFLEEIDYIDPSEYGGHSGHYADESMYDIDDDEEE